MKRIYTSSTVTPAIVSAAPSGTTKERLATSLARTPCSDDIFNSHMPLSRYKEGQRSIQ